MEMITAYMAGIIFVIGMFTWRVPHESLRTVFLLGLIWPVSILFTLILVMLNSMRWEMDVANSTKMFGFRKSTNPKMRGVAVSVFGTELQFYSPRKTVDQ